MSDGIGNNNSYHLNDITHVSDLAPGVNRSFVDQKQQHMHQQQHQQKSGRYPKGGVMDHHRVTQHKPPMMMNDNRSLFPSPHPQQLYQQTNSKQYNLPTFANNSDNHYNNFHRQNDNFQPEKIQMLPRGQQERGHQQKLTRSLPVTSHNNGRLLHDSSSSPFSQSLPQLQVSRSLEALRADIHRQTLELEQLEKQVGYSSSSVPSSIIQPSNESLFPNRLQQQQQQQQTNLPSKPLFHSEDPLGFCLDGNANGDGSVTTVGNKRDPFAPVSVSMQPPQNPEQMATISHNHDQVSRQDAVITALSPTSPDSSQTKRRRLNSDQMLHMFLSDTIIESPNEVSGKKLLVPTATSTTAEDDGAEDRDSGMPRPPFSDDESMTSRGDDESTKLQDSYDKQSRQEATDSAQIDVSQPIITPSTATISKLTAEIRSQALMKSEQMEKVRTTSSSKGSQDSSFGPNQDKPTTTTATAAGLAKIASAMEASQTSQQNIHDWDKKFGLKRAHSKTMRESCRSRKKVLDFLKGEIDEGKESVLSTMFEEIGASAAANCSDIMTIGQEEQQRDQGSLSSSSSHSSGNNEDADMSAAKEDKDDMDGELEGMFRRASLDCMDSILGDRSSLLERVRQSSSGSSASSDKSVADTLRSSMTLTAEEEDRVQYNARCA